MSWELTLFLAAAIHGIILSIILFIRSANRRKRFLAAYLLAFSLTVLNYVFFWAQAVELHFIIQWPLVLSPWAMPFLFYYFMNERAKLNRLPFHLTIPVLLPLHWLLIPFARVGPSYFENIGHILIFLQAFVFIGYGIAAVRGMKRNKTNWIFIVAYTSFIVGLLSYAITTLINTYSLRVDYIMCAGFVLLTYGITYLSEFNFLKEKEKPKYSSSSLTKEDGQYLVQKINEVLIQNKYYKDPDFSLSSFAEKLGVPKYRISQALNAFSEKSFSELINEFRVEDAKDRLQQKSSIHLKLEAIGEEVGFRNKVSFYKNFKKIVGSSPGEFRESHTGKSA